MSTFSPMGVASFVELGLELTATCYLCRRTHNLRYMESRARDIFMLVDKVVGLEISAPNSAAARCKV